MTTRIIIPVKKLLQSIEDQSDVVFRPSECEFTRPVTIDFREDAHTFVVMPSGPIADRDTMLQWGSRPSLLFRLNGMVELFVKLQLQAMHGLHNSIYGNRRLAELPDMHVARQWAHMAANGFPLDFEKRPRTVTGHIWVDPQGLNVFFTEEGKDRTQAPNQFLLLQQVVNP